MKSVVFTQRVEVIESYNERRDCADQRISDFIRTCGFLPVPIPNYPKIAEEIVETINPSGIVLVGGNSLVKYGGNAPERDETDKILIDLAIRKSIPLYGFCRGMQSILDYFGESLVKVSGHVAVHHEVKGVEGTDFVNSYHNEACISLKSNDLIPLLSTDDGVIEKVKHSVYQIVGTMWHPEREKPFREKDIRLLTTLIGGNEK